MNHHKRLLLIGLVACTANGLLAQVDPQIERHHRSLKRFHDTPVSAPETPAEKNPPTRPAPAAAPAEDNVVPPDAKPGECYTRVLVSPAMSTVSERVLVKDESYELVEIPAVLETIEERVMVRAASERQEIIPATYKEIEERVLKAPAYVRQIPVPAKFETRTERVLVKPERSYWKKGTGSLQKFDGETGEIMCYVTDPAVYENVTRQVVAAPASIRTEEVPAVYETIKRTVIDQPAQIKKIPVPAEYASVKVQKIKTPARTEKRVIPAEYANVTRHVAQGQSRLEWRRVLCETNVTPELIADVQTGLNARNFNAGPVDGVYGKATQKAVADFQAANNLPQGGLTYETLAALGVGK